jgi:adenosylmethionine-8-amino-7-oxononanoate aminotransferase
MIMTNPHAYAVHRRWDRDYHIMERTSGIYLYDSEGNRFIDGTGGSAAVVGIGHDVQEVAEAMYEQAQKFSFYPCHAFSNEPFRELSESLVKLAPGDMKGNAKVWATCCGTGATDDAVRLARQYWVEKGVSSRFMVIGRWQAFHGNNIAVASYSGITGRRAIFAPMHVASPHIPPAFCYRCYFGLEYPSCGLRCAWALETEIQQNGPENVAAFIAEPVVGSALASAPAPDGYFQVIREICDKYDVLFIDDEVQAGFGRTGKMWGIEHWGGVTPDIMVLAKGIGSGYTPISAIVARNEIWQPLIDNNSPFKAGRTLNANAVSCAGAIAVLRYLQENNLVQRAAETGGYILSQMKDKLLKHRMVGDVRGKGLLLGFELVKDKETKEPFHPSLRIPWRLEDEAFSRGLITYPGCGSLDGQVGDITQLAPPLTITREQSDEIVRILDESITALEAEVYS